MALGIIAVNYRIVFVDKNQLVQKSHKSLMMSFSYMYY